MASKATAIDRATSGPRCRRSSGHATGRIQPARPTFVSPRLPVERFFEKPRVGLSVAAVPGLGLRGRTCRRSCRAVRGGELAVPRFVVCRTPPPWTRSRTSAPASFPPPVVDGHASRSRRRRADRVVPSFRSCGSRGSGRRPASGGLFPGARPRAGGSCAAEAPGVGARGASARVPSVFVCALSALSCLSSCAAGVGVFVRPSRKSVDTRNSCAALLRVCIRIEPRPFSIFETLEWSNRSPSAAASSDWFSPACFRQRASRLPRSLVPVRDRRRLARRRRGFLLRFVPCIAFS